MRLVFEDDGQALHRFDVFEFHDMARMPAAAAPYLLLAENPGPRGPAFYTAIYAGESQDCRARCESHAKTLARFQRGAAATVSERLDTGIPAVVLIAADWRHFVTPCADPRTERMQYEERLKFLFSPICDFQSRHLTAHRGGRRYRPGNHLVCIERRRGRLVYARPDERPWPERTSSPPAEEHSVTP